MLNFQLKIAIAACILSLTVTAEAAEPDSLLYARQVNFDNFAQRYPQERVYLHFDNTSYYKGEHIWYKAYVVEGGTLQPSPLSRILYVELVNPIGYPVETQKLMVRNGQASGSFLLKDSLNSGFYEVRAYTAWMLNFTPSFYEGSKAKTGDAYSHGWDRITKILTREFFGERLQQYLRGNVGIFSRVFPVYEKVDKGQYDRRLIARLPKATASLEGDERDRLLVDFYPEGGNLVRNIPTRVAFQARTKEGRTLNVEGQIVRKGKAIGTFKTDYAGRGVFSVTANENDEEEDLADGLKMKFFYNGKNYTFKLPKSHKRGYVLNVFNSGGETVRATVARNSLTPGERLGLSVTARGATLYYDALDLTADLRADVTIETASLLTGVNIFTLYNEQGKVLAQREVFVNNHDMDGLRLQVTMPDGEEKPQPFGKVTLQCRLVDKDGNPATGRNRFSLAVTDKQFREGTYADDNAMTYLLLSSELKGFIPHPEYYFESDDHEHRAALDQLMMVQGWTRYDYERMMSGKPWSPIMAIERGLNFRGRVVGDHGPSDDYLIWKKIKQPVWVYNETRKPFSGFSTTEVMTDSLGFFMFNINPFFGKARMSLMLNKESASVIGNEAAGIRGHSFTIYNKKRPIFLIDKYIVPFNAYSPVARNYDYYETKALNEPVDKNIFKTGFMASANDYGVAYFDKATNTYTLMDVVKHGRRRWTDFRSIQPVAVIDVRDLMSHLSNIFGSINDFHIRKVDWDEFRLSGNDQTKGGWWQPGEGNVQNNFGDDNFFADMEKYGLGQENGENGQNEGDVNHVDPVNGKLKNQAEEEGRRARAMRVYNRWWKNRDHRFAAADLSYYNYKKLLLLLGFDGANLELIDAPDHGELPSFLPPGVYGETKLLPTGFRFFPADINISKLRLYADVNDRSNIHREGRYLEYLTPFSPGGTTSDLHPLTSIINLEVDSIYPDGVPEPDFYGYKINFQGLSEPDEFYRVDYSRQPLPEEGDFRRTLYWNPGLATDEEGKAKVTFYNNGFSTSFAVSAQGVTSNGFITTEGKP